MPLDTEEAGRPTLAHRSGPAEPVANYSRERKLRPSGLHHGCRTLQFLADFEKPGRQY